MPVMKVLQGFLHDMKKDINHFLERSRKKHGNKYNYSLVNYTNNKAKVKIICPAHGMFEQAAFSHYSSGCPECGKQIARTIGFRHGGIETSEYRIWQGVKNRCNNPKVRSYPAYGGRGIKVCDRWLEKYTGFINFLKDMGNRPSPEHSIDRVDNDGDYCPENCRWATNYQQSQNTRPQARNSTGIKHITAKKYKGSIVYQVQRIVNKKRYYGGEHSTIEGAQIALDKINEIVYKEEVYGNPYERMVNILRRKIETIEKSTEVNKNYTVTVLLEILETYKLIHKR